MLTQILLLPLYLFLFAGKETLTLIKPHPFVEAFLTLIVIPLILAGITQKFAPRFTFLRRLWQTMEAAMVPLMMLTLASVIGSHIGAIGSQATTLTRLVPLYIIFVFIALILGHTSSALFHLDVASTRAVMFSGVTRNSLVVLPLALALPKELSIAPLAIVTQTLVELIAMVTMVRMVPYLIPYRVN